MSQNCVLHSAWHSVLPKICSALDTPRNFRRATMAPLNSRKGLDGPKPKGRWRLSWTKRRYGWNLGSLIWTKLETTTNEWNHPGSPRPKKVRPTQCAVKVTFIVVYDIDGVKLHHAVPPRQTVNAAYYCTFLQHHLPPALRRKRRRLVAQYPSFFMTFKGVSPLLLLHGPLAPIGNVRFLNVYRTYPLWVHTIRSLHRSERPISRDPLQHKR